MISLLIALLVALLISVIVHANQLLILVNYDDLLVVSQGTAVAQHANHQKELINSVAKKHNEQNEVQPLSVYPRTVGIAVLKACVEVAA